MLICQTECPFYSVKNKSAKQHRMFRIEYPAHSVLVLNRLLKYNNIEPQELLYVQEVFFICI